MRAESVLTKLPIIIPLVFLFWVLFFLFLAKWIVPNLFEMKEKNPKNGKSPNLCPFVLLGSLSFSSAHFRPLPFVLFCYLPFPSPQEREREREHLTSACGKVVRIITQSVVVSIAACLAFCCCLAACCCGVKICSSTHQHCFLSRWTILTDSFRMIMKWALHYAFFLFHHCCGLLFACLSCCCCWRSCCCCFSLGLLRICYCFTRRRITRRRRRRRRRTTSSFFLVFSFCIIAADLLV